MRERTESRHRNASRTGFNRVNALTTLMLAAFLVVVVTTLLTFRFVPNRPETMPLSFFFAVGVFLFSLSAGILFIYSQVRARTADENEQALREAIESFHRRTTQLQVAARIARDATAEPELSAVLSSAAKAIHERFGFYYVGIFLLDETGQTAQLRAAGGSAGELLLEKQHTLDINEGLVGYAIRMRQAMIVLDVSKDANHVPNPILSETQSEMSIPLIVRGSILGAVDVQSSRLAAFDQEDLNIMQTLADLLAVAIEKAQLYEAVQSYADEMEKRVSQRTHEFMMERAQLNAILNAMMEGVIYSLQNKPRYMNVAFRQMTGYDMGSWQGFLPLVQLDSDTDDLEKSRQIYRRIYDEIIKRGFWHGELRVRRVDGSEFDAYVTSTRITNNETTREQGTVTIIRDISQEKQLQEQKMRFVSYASHELRTPIANLKTRLYLLRRQPERTDVHMAVLEQVTERMQRLVQDLLLQSRFERGNIPLKLEPVRLQELMLDVVSMQRPEADHKQITLSAEMPSTRLMAHVDRDRITQVMTNLISNAINYTQHGGRVWVRLRDNGQNQAEITVKDTGIGIPDDMIDQIFQPFFRAQNVVAEGTGLGLNITKQIIDLHGGHIGVSSQLGEGSSFTVWLSLLPAENALPAGNALPTENALPAEDLPPTGNLTSSDEEPLPGE